MVLQSKVFLISILQRFTPVVSKKKTFIRRVKTQVKELGKSIRSIPGATVDTIRNIPGATVEVVFRRGDNSNENSKCFQTQGSKTFNSPAFGDEESCEPPPFFDEAPQPDFMAHFTKTPFPEPRRVIKIRPRFMDFQSESLAI